VLSRCVIGGEQPLGPEEFAGAAATIHGWKVWSLEQAPLPDEPGDWSPRLLAILAYRGLKGRPQGRSGLVHCKVLASASSRSGRGKLAGGGGAMAKRSYSPVIRARASVGE